MMNIGIYVHGLSAGGVEKQMSWLTKRLSEEAQFSFSLLTHVERQHFPYPLHDDVRIITFRDESPTELAEKISSAELDIIYVPRSSQNTHLLFIHALSSLAKPPKYIASEHVPPSAANKLFGSRYTRELIYTAADRIHLLSPKYIEELPLFLAQKSHAISNWVENKNNNYKDDGHRKIVSAGRLSVEKNFELLITAFAKIQKDYPDWSLHIYGDGPERGRLTRLIRHHGLEYNCEIKAFSSNYEDNFGPDDIYIQTSLWEGFGMALAEAVARGIPSVALSSSEGPKTFIKDKFNGFLLDIDDNPHQLAKELAKIIKDPKVRRRISKNAPKSMVKFSPDHIAAEWRNLFTELYEEGGPSTIERIRDREEPASWRPIAFLPTQTNFLSGHYMATLSSVKDPAKQPKIKSMIAAPVQKKKAKKPSTFIGKLLKKLNKIPNFAKVKNAVS